MSSASSIPNYRDTVFEYADLTAIHGEPTYDTLKILLNQLKANARSVWTTLGGGNHGYLDLVLSPQQYDILAPGMPFVRLAHPGPLVIPPYQLPHVTNKHNLYIQNDYVSTTNVTTLSKRSRNKL